MVSATYPFDGPAPGPDPDVHEIWLRSAAGGGVGVLIPVDEDDGAQLVRSADVVQDFIVEELPATGRPAVWPECPDHPDTHPLQPVEDDNGAGWSCPRTGRWIRPIAAL